VLEKNGNVRALVENGWVHLHSLAADGTIHRFDAVRDWRPASKADTGLATSAG
jgi:hypothetical protein